MRGRSQQEDVIRRVAKQFTELVALALVRLVPGRHAMGLVHNHEVPLDLAQPGQDVLPLREVERRDNPFLLEPLVDTELITQVAPLQDQKLLVEFLLQLPLPLECEIGGSDDQDSLGQAAHLELPDEQSRHDRLAGAGVVGEQEADAGELEEVVVDRLELVRERVNT